MASVLRFSVLLAGLALRIEFAVIRGTNRFLGFIAIHFILLEFVYVVLLDVELAFANVAAMLFIRETLMTSVAASTQYRILSS